MIVDGVFANASNGVKMYIDTTYITFNENGTITCTAECAHSYSSVVTEPSCTENGKTVYTCTICGDSYEESITALGHSYDAVVTAPDCENGGYTTYTCSVCGDSYIADQVDALGHTEVIDPGTAPDCDSDGLTEGSHCSVCGKVLVEQVPVSANGHSYEGVVTAPDCENGGYTTYTCVFCGDSYIADQVDALGHTEVIDAAVAPDCVNTGLTEGKHCSVCKRSWLLRKL